MLDPIDISNGFRQRCCMAPVNFNLHSCVVIERWIEIVKDFEEVGRSISEVQAISENLATVHPKSRGKETD